MFKQRILIQLSVRGDIRFVSHHDLMRVVGRGLRRADLPVAMSEGFNPRQRISLLLARGVGIASEGEFAEIDLDGWVSVGEFSERLNAHLPEGLRVERAELGHPRRRRRVVGIDYHVECRRTLELTQADAENLLARTELWVERKRKKARSSKGVRRVNIRPFIKSIRVDGRSVRISLKVSGEGTTRVEEVWQALGLDPQALLAESTITRCGMDISPSS